MHLGANFSPFPGNRRNVLPWLMLFVGVSFSLFVFGVIRGAIDDVARLRFERQARDAVAVINERIQFYSDILYGLRALFASQGPVTRLQFNRFVSAMDLKERFPGFDVVNYAIYVRADEKERFVQSVRADTSLSPEGYPRFDIRPPGKRPDYYVLAYVEPMQGFEFAFGRDLGANMDAADPQPLVVALNSARDSGKLTASGVPIRIKSRGREYTGLAVRLAVYRSGMRLETIDERREAYLGSVGAGFNVEDLMKGVLDERALRHTRFQVYDVRAVVSSEPPAKNERRLLFDSVQTGFGQSVASHGQEWDAQFKHMLSTEVGGRVWEVHFSAPKKLVADRVDAFLPWLFLIGGLISSALLSGLFYSLASSRSRAVAIAEDITKDLRTSENELRASAEQLQALSRRLVEVQESERKELSRELHDRVGQNLTALSIDLDIVRSQLPETVDTALRLRMDDATDLLASTTDTIENVMAELRPPMLDDYGLFPALEWYANEYARRTGIAAQVQADVQPGRIAQAAEIALFRIMQEALNNVAKHAHATRVDIVLARTDTQLTMSINDNGKGYDARTDAGTLRRFGLGMATMRERTQAVGGAFAIDSAPGGGTRIVVRVPC